MKTLVVGLGNRDRGDDALGLVVADLLAAYDVAADVVAWERPELDLLEVLPRYDRVMIVDAARGGKPLGTLHGDIDLVAETGSSMGSHSFGLAGVLELAEALDRVPPHLDLLLVEAGSFEHGRGLSAPVDAAVHLLVGRLVRELAGDADVPR